MQSVGSTRARTRLLPFLCIPLLALVALIAWGFASPIGAGPDDDFHLASAWCGAGTDAECQPADDESERRLSVDLWGSAACFAFHSDQSAVCQMDRFGDDFGDDLTTGLGATDRGNFESNLYPPVYYFAMSPFAGENFELSAMTMRVINSVLFVAVVVALFWLLPRARRPVLILALVATCVPLGMSLIPSNNPSGWAILSAGTFWIALLGFFESQGKRRVGLGLLAALTMVIGAGARADSALYVLLSIAVVLVLKFHWNRRFLLLSLVPIALALIAIVLLLSANQVTAASNGLEPNQDKPPYNQYTLIVQNLLEVPGLWSGVFGTWNLGWLDTPMPALVSFGALGAFFAIVVLGLGDARDKLDVRKLLAALGVLLMLWAIPTVILYRSETIVGLSVQPRYVMPLLILLAGICLLRRAGDPIRVSGAQALLIAGALAAANSVALHTNIRRYVTGLDGAWGNLDKGIEWWWSIPVSPMGIWAIGSITFAAMLVWLAWLWIAESRSTDDREADYLVPPRRLETEPLVR